MHRRINAKMWYDGTFLIEKSLNDWEASDEFLYGYALGEITWEGEEIRMLWLKEDGTQLDHPAYTLGGFLVQPFIRKDIDTNDLHFCIDEGASTTNDYAEPLVLHSVCFVNKASLRLIGIDFVPPYTCKNGSCLTITTTNYTVLSMAENVYRPFRRLAKKYKELLDQIEMQQDDGK